MRIATLAALTAAGALAPVAVGGDVVGPGPVERTLVHGPYRLVVQIAPNAGGRRRNAFVVRTSRGGKPVSAGVSAVFTMPEMGMPPLSLRLRQTAPGVAQGAGETLTMTGRWHVALRVTPHRAPAFTVLFLDVVRL